MKPTFLYLPAIVLLKHLSVEKFKIQQSRAGFEDLGPGPAENDRPNPATQVNSAGTKNYLIA